MTAEEVASRVADAVASIRRAHPVRVGVDGRSAAGKTTFADMLAAELQRRGREVLRAELDDFHRPGHKWRSMRGEWTPQSYYDEGYDYEAVARLLLAPLDPGGDRDVRTGAWDSLHDRALPEVWHEVDAAAIVLVDGAFLLRPELASHWDYVIWLDVDFQTMVSRAKARDIAWVGSVREVERRYREHWIPTHELYESREDPRNRADAVIDANDWSAPGIVRLLTG